MGPTASGKTDAAIYLSKYLPCEVISVDATCVYRGLDIGSAKPDKETLQHTPHHLIDIRDPAQSYSVAEFCEDALQLIHEIHARGKIPLLVGGSMLYFKALRDGLGELPHTDPEIRAKVVEEAARIGWPAMHEKLAAIDPPSAARLHPNHSQRIGRALEVYFMTGETLTQLQLKQKPPGFPFPLLQLALIPQNREALYRRIDQRFDHMMEQGFLSEVEMLYQRGNLHKELPAIRAVGYRQAWDYLAQRNKVVDAGKLGESLTREQMIVHAKIASRQLAKRQLTWLRSWPNLQSVTLDFAASSGSVVGANCLQAVKAFLYPDA